MYDKRSAKLNGRSRLAAADAYEEWYTNGDSGRVATVRYICRPSSDDMIRIATKALYDDKGMFQGNINGDDTNNAVEINEEKLISIRAEHVLDSNMYEFTLKSSASVYNLASKIFHKTKNENVKQLVNIIYNGEILAYENKLEDIFSADEIHVIFALEDNEEGGELYYSLESEADEVETKPSPLASGLKKANNEKPFRPPKLFNDLDNKIVNISEPSALTYVVTFLTPLACVRDDFKEKYLRQPETILDFNNDPDLSRVSVGDFCYAYTRRRKSVAEYNSGHITHINSDGTLSVQFDDGKFKGKVMPQDLIVFD